MSIQEHEITLRLRWGLDSARTIKVPVEYRKGSYSQRYELYVDNTHIGWVVKHSGKWESYIVGEQSADGWNHVVGIAMTRTEAIDWLVFKLGQAARTNVLADRAEAAYADEAAK